ncbi:MFS transporter [Kutzneria sp. NPDC052558]|uniref:MFS transporter n=1 Tax=Kutzneria sp. NPDC052558 TaxID=3364121 RepID=UPI0037C8614F
MPGRRAAMTTVQPTAQRPATVRAATRATYAAFAGSGVLLSSGLARLPQIRVDLGLDTGQLGAILLAGAAGALISRPFSGRVVTRLGQGRAVAWTSALSGVALVLIGLGDRLGAPVFAGGMLLFGLFSSVWDVAMNIQGTVVERRLGRSIMPRFHAGYSVGTVAGALLGAAMVQLDVPVPVHLTIVAVAVAVVLPYAVRGFLPDERHSTKDDPRPHSTLRYWREPRTLMIGVFVLAAGFSEGAGNDWTGVSLVDGYRTSPALGTLAYATFLAAMTATRWFGPRLLDRHGRVVVLRIQGAVAVLGLLLFIFAPAVPLAFVGTALWGAGVAFGYPVGMSAAADDPAHAAGRVTVASSVAKIASFAGPPLLGLLGDHVTILRALLAVAALQVVALCLAQATRPLAPVDPDRHRALDNQ